MTSKSLLVSALEVVAFVLFAAAAIVGFQLAFDSWHWQGLVALGLALWAAARIIERG